MDKPTLRVGNTDRVLDARPDPLDFRDKMYEATLVYVPPERTLQSYLDSYPAAKPVEILDQHSEGACTGFALAAVANHLLRTSRIRPPATAVKVPEAPVSERMLYEMARRYDEWPGEEYSGSSARGAMKGWHKHGVCARDTWPYIPGHADNVLSSIRAAEARERPLGAYYRVNHQDLVAMHAAIAEVGILYATARVHSGWRRVKVDGLIPQTDELIGGHAFAIVAYDDSGFWIQNSWGPTWGRNGFCKITYDDWLENGTDIWAARLGVPVTLKERSSIAILQAAGVISSPSEQQHELRPHIISIGNDGLLRNTGPFATNDKEVQSIFAHDVRDQLRQWHGTRRILLHAHGGLVSEASAIQRVAEYRPALLDNQIFPISFIWKTDYLTTVMNILRDAFQRRKPEGILDSAKDFLLDRADDALEPLARTITGKQVWSEMKENAVAATTKKSGGARKVALELANLLHEEEFKDVEIHVVSHSAGAVFMGPLVKLLASKPGAAKVGVGGLGLPIRTCTLWAPACTIEFFKQNYGPVLPQLGSVGLFTLTDGAEKDDDCAKIYHKSLLYLVSYAFEDVPRIPLLSPGTPILGMEKWLRALSDPKSKQRDAAFAAMLGRIEHIRSPNTDSPATGRGSTASHHGDFDNDDATVKSTLSRIVGVSTVTANLIAAAKLPILQTQSNRRARRQAFDQIMA
jgi:hypothetical protein